MEECPQCGRMTAERSIYTEELICYDRRCDYGSDIQEELSFLDHTGLFQERLNNKDRELEFEFASQWKKINTDPYRRGVNYGRGMLQDLMFDPKTSCPIFEITQREATIVATIVQWLGTNVGFAFIETALRNCGLSIEPLPKHLFKEKKEEVNKRQLLIINN